MSSTSSSARILKLYDLVPRPGGASFSPGCMRARLALMAKGVPFEVVQVTYHDLRFVWKDRLGVDKATGAVHLFRSLAQTRLPKLVALSFSPIHRARRRILSHGQHTHRRMARRDVPGPPERLPSRGFSPCRRQLERVQEGPRILQGRLCDTTPHNVRGQS